MNRRKFLEFFGIGVPAVMWFPGSGVKDGDTIEMTFDPPLEVPVFPYGSASFYEAGTTTPKVAYADSNLHRAYPNPLPLTGEVKDIYFKGPENSRVQVKDANGVIIWTTDDLAGSLHSPTPLLLQGQAIV